MIPLIGLIGGVCIVLAFIPETIKTIKKGKVEISYSFLILYLIGSASLTYYAFILKDSVFMALNGLLVVESLINLYYKVSPRHR